MQAGDLETALREVNDQPSRALLVNVVADRGAGAGAGGGVAAGHAALIRSAPGVQESAGAFGVADYLVKPIARVAMLAARLAADHIGDDPDRGRRTGGAASFPAHPGIQWARLSRCRAWPMVARPGPLRAEHPDAMLMDLVMPNMDGFQLLEVIQDDPDRWDIPVIITSARDPAGQPIISRGLAVNMQEGLSANACWPASKQSPAPARNVFIVRARRSSGIHRLRTNRRRTSHPDKPVSRSSAARTLGD